MVLLEEENVSRVSSDLSEKSPKTELFNNATLDDFPDYWKAEIEQQLGKKTVSVDELSQIRRLGLMRIEDIDFAPIKYFVSLDELVSSGSTSKDFSPIGDVATLKKLYLAKTNLSDITFLADHKNLEKLSIGNSRVTDISVLPQLKKLKDISLKNLEIHDYSPLRQCNKIKSLDMSGCKNFDVMTISSLKLRSLILDDIILENMEFLIGQSKLEELSFDMCISKDFSVIAGLNSLTDITCPYEFFMIIKDLMDRKIRFAIKGDMTSNQYKCYEDYILK